MADTRVANATYHLDVDEMILEYLLYHAIEYSLADGPAVSQNINEQLPRVKWVKDGGRQREDATRLVAIFDGTVFSYPVGYVGGAIKHQSNTHSQIS